MDTTLLVEIASASGITGPAMVDALARAETYFGAKELTPDTLSAWITELQATAPHFFAPLQPGPTPPPGALPPAWMKAEERMTWARERAPQAPEKRRPSTHYEASAAQLKALEGKTTAEKMTLYRQWRDQAQGGAL